MKNRLLQIKANEHYDKKYKITDADIKNVIYWKNYIEKRQHQGVFKNYSVDGPFFGDHVAGFDEENELIYPECMIRSFGEGDFNNINLTVESYSPLINNEKPEGQIDFDLRYGFNIFERINYFLEKAEFAEIIEKPFYVKGQNGYKKSFGTIVFLAKVRSWNFTSSLIYERSIVYVS
ncbi:MAG: hypothetical protein RBR08_05625 [Desulforegulaceae bacterium]|nr:hypothetical protein [Desulforegulaceae bacterium]